MQIPSSSSFQHEEVRQAPLPISTNPGTDKAPLPTTLNMMPQDKELTEAVEIIIDADDDDDDDDSAEMEQSEVLCSICSLTGPQHFCSKCQLPVHNQPLGKKNRIYFVWGDGRPKGGHPRVAYRPAWG